MVKTYHAKKGAEETAAREVSIKELGRKYKLTKAAAEIFRTHGDNYPKDGPVTLPDNIIDEVASALILASIPLDVVRELDEKPYKFLPYDLAAHIHWFSRRFRNSCGWDLLESDHN